MAHALLSPSSAARWLACTPSARLEADCPDRAGDAADEGTLAHKLAESMLEYELKRCTKEDFNKKLKAIQKNKFYTESMYEYCDQYKVFVLERYNEALARDKHALVFLEQQVDLTVYIKEGFGTRDITIIAAGILEVIDLKYGKGIHVEATENKQLMLYGLGTLEEYDMLYDISKVRLTIYQPRLDNFSTWDIDADFLKQWGEEVLKPSADLAWEGKGKFNPGPHCGFCKVRATCRANADYQLDLAAYEFTEPALLSDDELVSIFNRVGELVSWSKAIANYLLIEAINNGKQWPGLKLVEGKSAGRKIKNQGEAIKLLAKAKILDEKYLSKPELLGITALEKNIGKAELNRLIGILIERPPGKPTLVDESDKRPAYNPIDQAALDFADENFDE